MASLRRASTRFVLSGFVAFALVAAAAPPARVAAPAPSLDGSAGIRFVAYGDSLTLGYGNPGPPWPVELAAMRQDLTLVRNAGLQGNTSAYMLAHMDRFVYAYRPDALFLLAGAVDLVECVPVTNVIANMKAIVAAARDHGTSRVVLILNSHYVRMDGRAEHPCGPRMNAGIDQLDDALERYGISAGVQTIDLRTLLDTDGHFSPGFFIPDGVHYNARGVDLVCQTIDRALSAGFNRHLRGPS